MRIPRLLGNNTVSSELYYIDPSYRMVNIQPGEFWSNITLTDGNEKCNGHSPQGFPPSVGDVVYVNVNKGAAQLCYLVTKRDAPAFSESPCEFWGVCIGFKDTLKTYIEKFKQ